MTNLIYKQQQRGALLVLVLVLSAIIFVIFTGTITHVLTQNRLAQHTTERTEAREIAEAGINYYKWFLAHYPGDVTHGTGLPGPFTMAYSDPELGAIGEYTITLASTTYCGEVSSIEITSTGSTYNKPNVKETIVAKYARPTVAEYSYIINSNVWAGSDRTIVGPYHSNGGVRMDGTNNSMVTSGQATWSCTSSFGCSPNSTEDGVFTSTVNANPALFAFPAPPINFTGLTVDLAQMKTRAQGNGGIYIGPSGYYGYHLTFNSNGTITVQNVTNTYNYEGYTTENGWQYERNIIRSESAYNTFTIDAECPLIYVEDKVWLDGDVPGYVTVAAADTDTPGVDPSLVLNDDINYSTSSAGLLAIGEQDVLLGVVVPDTMNLHGIFVAQNGRYGRNHYQYSDLPNPSGPTDYRPYYKRDTLNMTGTIVSNGRVGEKWTSGGTYISGFDVRNNSYDRDLVDNPPPLAPNTSDDYRFIDWRQQ